MSSKEEKDRGVGGISYGEPQQYHYGTFQGVANYHPPPPTSQHQPPPAVGFPQPAPPSGAPYYSHGYHTVHGYAVAEGTPVRERRLRCCGLGIGWFLFLIGFIFGAIPWYIGAFMLMCARVDYREKPGLIACTIAVSVLLVLAPLDGILKIHLNDFLFGLPSYILTMLHWGLCFRLQSVVIVIAVTLGLMRETHVW
ncbi:hypothetical protein RJ641_017951 [Dillenia turbinata]|uniref:60S ribosomal protein L18a-like protein n=1 Tax=Dillenia turbinata TaxID=194707 RepID=A0AAN8UKJ5_9MAGN